MEPSVLQINKKSETKNEVGLPKHPVNEDRATHRDLNAAWAVTR